MATVPEIEQQIKDEAWQGVIVRRQRNEDGDTIRWRYNYILKDIRIDDPSNITSDTAWQLSQNVLISDEGGAGENAYFEGIWKGPIYNAYLRYLMANVSAPRYAYRHKFISNTEMEFVIMDVSTGYAVDTMHKGVLQDGDLIVT